MCPCECVCVRPSVCMCVCVCARAFVNQKPYYAIPVLAIRLHEWLLSPSFCVEDAVAAASLVIAIPAQTIINKLINMNV